MINKVLASLSEQDGFGKYVAYLEYAWQPIAIMALATILITFIYIWLLKCITRPLLYVSIFIILAAFIGLGYWVYTLKDSPDVSTENHKYYEYGAYILWVLAFMYFCCIMCCWNSLALGGAIMEASSEFIT